MASQPFLVGSVRFYCKQVHYATSGSTRLIFSNLQAHNDHEATNHTRTYVTHTQHTHNTHTTHTHTHNTPPSGGGGLTRASTHAQALPATRSSDRAAPRLSSSSAVQAARPQASWSSHLPLSAGCWLAWSAVAARRAWAARRAARRWNGCARRARCSAVCMPCTSHAHPTRNPRAPYVPTRRGPSRRRAYLPAATHPTPSIATCAPAHPPATPRRSFVSPSFRSTTWPGCSLRSSRAALARPPRPSEASCGSRRFSTSGRARRKYLRRPRRRRRRSRTQETPDGAHRAVS